MRSQPGTRSRLLAWSSGGSDGVQRMSGYCTTQNLEFMNLKASVAMSLPSRAYPTNKRMSSTQPDRFHYALANYTTLVFDVDPDPGDRPAEAAQVAICSRLSKGDHSFLPTMAAAESRNNLPTSQSVSRYLLRTGLTRCTYMLNKFATATWRICFEIFRRQALTSRDVSPRC